MTGTRTIPISLAWLPRPSPALPAGVALVVTAWTIPALLESPSAVTPGPLAEAGGCLVLGLLLMTAARAVDRAGRVVCVAGRRRLRIRTAFALIVPRGLLEACVAAGLSLPALVAAWECGGTASDLRALVAGGAAAVSGGLVAGALLGALRAPAFAGATLAGAAAGIALWPASLGWIARETSLFPRPEAIAPAAILALLALAALALRARTGRA